MQSLKNTGTAARKAYDARGKNLGIKRHISEQWVSSQGLPYAVTAEITGRKGALQAFACGKPDLHRAQGVLCGSGYVGKPFA